MGREKQDKRQQTGRVLPFGKAAEMVARTDAAMCVDFDAEPYDDDDSFTVIVVRGKVAAELGRKGATVVGAPVVAAEDSDGGHADGLSHAESLRAREQLFWMNGMFDPGAPPQFVGAIDDISDDTVRQWCLRQMQKLRQMIDDHDRYLQESPHADSTAPENRAAMAAEAENHGRDLVRFAMAYHATLSTYWSSGYDPANCNDPYVLPAEDSNEA